MTGGQTIALLGWDVVGKREDDMMVTGRLTNLNIDGKTELLPMLLN